MLSGTIKKLLNEQIALENQASFDYLGMAAWAEIAGYDGAADFFYRQSNEEREHMLKIIRYITEMDEHPILPVGQVVRKSYKTLQELFVQALQNELSVSNSIEQKVAACIKSKDFTTFSFLQWFINEQREEVLTMRTMLKLFDNIKPDGLRLALYTIDQSLYNYPKKTKTP